MTANKRCSVDPEGGLRSGKTRSMEYDCMEPLWQYILVEAAPPRGCFILQKEQTIENNFLFYILDNVIFKVLVEPC